jgi:hypothetical protein
VQQHQQGWQQQLQQHQRHSLQQGLGLQQVSCHGCSCHHFLRHLHCLDAHMYLQQQQQQQVVVVVV